MLVALAVFVALISFLYHHFTKYNSYWKERNVPGPEPTFFYGNIKDVALRKRSTKDIYKEIYDKYPDKKIVGIFHMRSPVLLVKDLDIIKHILIKDFETFADRDTDFAEQGLEANLFAFNGDIWRTLRKSCSPFFTPLKLKAVMYLLLERADRLVDCLEKATSEQPILEINEITSKFTQSCITACGFGLDIDMDNSTNILKRLEPKIYTYTHKAELEMMYPGILKRLKLAIGHKEVLDFFTDLTKNIMSQRHGEPSGKSDFMDFMLSIKKAKSSTGGVSLDVTDELMIGQMFIFYAAGYHTSSLTMSFMLHMLAIHTDIQEKVHAEIDQVLEKYEGKFTYEAVSEMKYMDQVFNETLRLYPVSDTLKRRARVDYKVPGTDLTVKKGQIFVIPIPIVHMDPSTYPDPEVFDPDRFIPENVAARHSCAFLPFGLGPRQCLGFRLAELQSRVGMAKLLSAFRVEPSGRAAQQFQYKASFHLQPRGGFPLKFTSRRP